jgi:uncharacterized repeat protein (TIGR01451 family)
MNPATKALRALTVIALAGALSLVPAAAPGQVSGPDLSVSKADSPDPVAPGADLTYTITVRNDGGVAAPGVMVADALVFTVDFVSATPSQGSCSELALVVTCSLGAIPAGGTATVVLVVRPTTSGSLINVVSAAPTPADLDENPANNVAVESTTVSGGSGPGADLAISKADAPDPVAPGADLNYTVTVQNLGPEAATDVHVTDVLPPIGASFVSASASQGSCGQPIALLLICDVGSLADGASATVQITVRPGAQGSLVNTAAAAAATFDPDGANNVAAASTTVSSTAGGGGGGGGAGAGAGGGAQALAACTILGTPLNDTLVGTEGADVICGLAGNDQLAGLGGKDVLVGGKDNDRANGGKAPDMLRGQSGKDRLRGGAKNDRLAGGGGADRLAGGPGKDRLNGGPGRDRCKRGSGDRLTKCP